MIRLFLRVLLWMVVCIGTLQFAAARNPVPDTVIVTPMADQWLIYTGQEEGYVPYLKDVHTDVNKVYLAVDVSRYRGFYLSIRGNQEAHLFVNNQLYHSFDRAEWLNLDIDRLSQKGQRSLLVAYYEPNSLNGVPESYITQGMYQRRAAVGTDTVTSSLAKERKPAPYREVMIIISLLLLLIMSVVSRLTKPVFSIGFIVKGLDSFIQGKNQIKRMQAIPFLVFLLYYGFTLSFSILFLDTHIGWVAYQQVLPLSGSTTGGLGKFLVIFLVVVLIVCTQYIIIWLMSLLYNDRQIANVHFQEYINISQIFCTIILVVMMLASSITHELSQGFLEGILFFFLACFVVKAVLMSYRLNKFSSYKKTYLFSYLCTTEYIPLLLSAKIFLIL